MSTHAHLSQTQREALAKALQAQLALLQHDSALHLEGMTQTEHANLTRLQDADDATQRVGAHEVEATTEAIESDDYNAVSSALTRIYTADYGICIDCHTAIPFDRLTVEPQALRCITCETLHERKK